MRRFGRSYKARLAVRKVAGVVLAAAGMLMMLRFIPGWFIVVALSIGMIWGGWLLFSYQD